MVQHLDAYIEALLDFEAARASAKDTKPHPLSIHGFKVSELSSFRKIHEIYAPRK
jgi:hypothetical protein